MLEELENLEKLGCFEILRLLSSDDCTTKYMESEVTRFVICCRRVFVSCVLYLNVYVNVALCT